MKKKNEDNTCEAFITILYNLTGTQYLKFESPDEINRVAPDVDFLLVSIVDERDIIAVEHTILESYEGQIGYVNRSYDIVGSINQECGSTIPNDRYYFLAIPPELINSLAGKNRKRFISGFASWVSKAALQLGIDKTTQSDYEGHNITLMCCGNNEDLNGNVWRMPQQPGNDEILRAQRLNRAISDKLPKLEQYKKSNFTTALLLEDIASIPSTVRVSLDEKSRIENLIDYLVVFASNKDRMVIGNVWKEKSIWHSSVPFDRRFSFSKSQG